MRILLTSSGGTAVGVWPTCCFPDSAGVGAEAAEELAKATGASASVRARPLGKGVKRTGRPPRGLHGSTDVPTPGEERGKAGIDCLFLRRAAERVSR